MAQHPLVVALGGNALNSEQGITDFPQLPPACEAMAGAADQGLVITHGNGPQIGLLAQQMGGDDGRPLDVLGAETEGLLGYSIEQELNNHLSDGQRVATLLTMMEVAPDDPAFDDPTKPIGPWLEQADAKRLQQDKGWQFLEKDGRFRRLVPSPKPVRVLEAPAIDTLLAADTAVICAGGGGIPVTRDSQGRLNGVEGVIDKDRASALLAESVQADLLVLATDVDGVYRDWNDGEGEKIDRLSTSEAARMDLETGSMGPKVEAACAFVEATGKPAVIGALADLDKLLQRQAGTEITP